MEQRLIVTIDLSHGVSKDWVEATIDSKDKCILSLGHADPKAALDAINSALRATLLK